MCRKEDWGAVPLTQIRTTDGKAFRKHPKHQGKKLFLSESALNFQSKENRPRGLGWGWGGTHLKKAMQSTPTACIIPMQGHVRLAVGS